MANPEEDEHVAEAGGFAGVYVRRTYVSEDGLTSAEISLMDDSPMMAAVSAFLATPLMGLTGNKQIRIDGYKGMFEEVADSDPKEFNINIPNNQSLLSMNFVNLDERPVTNAANEIPVGEIFSLIR